MSAPEQPLWRIEPVAIVPASNQEAALALIKEYVESIGGTYVGGGAAKVGSDE